MKDRIKEHDRDIRLVHTQTCAISEHTHNTGHYLLWDDCDPYWYTRRVKEPIYTRLHPHNINREVELKFQRLECPRSRNTTTGQVGKKADL